MALKNGCGIFWEEEELAYKEWDVKAFKQGKEADSINPIVQANQPLTPLGEEINGHACSKVSFPSSGLWKLVISIDGKYFDELNVDVKLEGED